MGKKKKKRGGKSLTRTAFKWIRVGALVGPGIAHAVKDFHDTGGKPEYALAGWLEEYTGYHVLNNTFNAQIAVRGWSPYIIACLATYGIPKLTSILRRL